MEKPLSAQAAHAAGTGRQGHQLGVEGGGLVVLGEGTKQPGAQDSPADVSLKNLHRWQIWLHRW
jgi:hypothetical protein